MKHLILLALFTFHSSLFTLSTSAAVPLKWTVETSRAVPAQFEAYQGETLALEAALQSYGKPLEAPANYSLYWQTNGMGNVWWSAPCLSHSMTTNILFATWSPTNDVGAKVYNCFIGQPGTIYHAAFQLRLRPSPGATPNELPLPQKVIDFAKVTVLNPPWSGGGGGGVDTNAVRDIIRDEITPTTNSLYTTLNGSIDVKRDKDDLAVYEVVRTENTDWTWTSENAELAAALNAAHSKPIWTGEEYHWDVILPGLSPDSGFYFDRGDIDSPRNALSVAIRFIDGGYETFATATRPRYMDEVVNVVDRLATTNGVNAAIDELAFTKVSTHTEIPFSVEWSDMHNGAHFNSGGYFHGWVYFGTGLGIGGHDWSALNRDGGITLQDDLNDKADRATTLLGYGITDATPLSMISATDQTFSNAVSTVAKTVTPPPSPTLRLFDDVRQCYWIGRMVNGVINWEVE